MVCNREREEGAAVKFCVQGVGFNAQCADPATHKVGGFWYCDEHAGDVVDWIMDNADEGEALA